MLNIITCNHCNAQNNLSKYSINPHSHVTNAVTCECCGKQISFIPDEDCWINNK